jgi:hypothetical protein
MGAFLTAIIILLALVIGWHLAFPIFGGIIAITATVWVLLVASVVVFSVAILLALMFTGGGIFILSLIAFIWIILAIIFFPILFPIIAPLFIILLFVSYFRRKQLKKSRPSPPPDERPGNF